MDATILLREQFKFAHGILEGTMQDVTAEHAHWSPPGNANPIGATYAHIVISEDMMFNGMVKGAAPPFATTRAGKTGLSEPPPAPGAGSWDEWVRSVQIDVPALQGYAKAVYETSDEYLASLRADELGRELDLSQMGKQTVGWFLGNNALSHISHHCGEVACLKGPSGSEGLRLLASSPDISRRCEPHIALRAMCGSLRLRYDCYVT